MNNFRPPEGCILCKDDPQFCGPFCISWIGACIEQVERDYRNNSPAIPMCKDCMICKPRQQGNQPNWLIED